MSYINLSPKAQVNKSAEQVISGNGLTETNAKLPQQQLNRLNTPDLQ